MFTEILFKMLLFKWGVLIYTEHCIYILYIYMYIYIYTLAYMHVYRSGFQNVQASKNKFNLLNYTNYLYLKLLRLF